MSIGAALGFAAIAQQMSQVQEAVNGAFKPLISNACEMPQRLDPTDAFTRCTTINAHAQKLQNVAKEGMDHLVSLREGGLSSQDDFSNVIGQLEALEFTARNSRAHALDMFQEAQRSPLWSGHESMIRPLQKKYIRALTAIENTAFQISQEIKQSQTVPFDLHDISISRKEALDVITASHSMLTNNKSNWI
ncbi:MULTISPECIES: hypothetical protein [Pantoea]|jgi:hypothetical protein|uniref:hypothetical protein n=1 Tax=Pantoea TaxID=53335 RepID=UPI000EA19963|nr:MULTISPECIES: hypothetical protein [Pantoea]MBZ6385537.1 hypothetical protein [Pantoea piersonii]MBZ6398919.1 hypothetical protein [Pantoea piersonii]MBZ6407583.1 hypothetical protein [Pantoea piersonii]MBZ6425466.1 hypothetical protein [Pantoea piersonii]NYB01011.1 hypothetical protein [Pantoea piersonii]